MTPATKLCTNQESDHMRFIETVYEWSVGEPPARRAFGTAERG
ncbi:MAG: hypothetical protein QOF11_683 [Chloroflexota bacterium]|nr:hypothetical protein [Chloroflexota bacterium]